MLLMLDVVANHVGPIYSLGDVAQLGAGDSPLSDPDGAQFHQLGKPAGESFADFIRPADVVAANFSWEGNALSTGCFPGNFSCPT